MHPIFNPNRRQLLESIGRFGIAGRLMGAACLDFPAGRNALAQTAPSQADHTIRIAPISYELAPGKIVKTTAYNGTVPGPVLRIQEGKPVTINVINESGYPNLVHWHGL